jgi:hypothetical protein
MALSQATPLADPSTRVTKVTRRKRSSKFFPSERETTRTKYSKNYLFLKTWP